MARKKEGDGKEPMLVRPPVWLYESLLAEALTLTPARGYHVSVPGLIVERLGELPELVEWFHQSSHPRKSDAKHPVLIRLPMPLLLRLREEAQVLTARSGNYVSPQVLIVEKLITAHEAKKSEGASENGEYLHCNQ